MITIEDDDYVKISLLLLKGGGMISEGILNREVHKSGKPIDESLETFEKKLKHQFHKKQMKVLYPTSGSTNIKDWDIQMITGVLLTVFKKDLEKEEKDAVEEIKSVRNEIYAHRSLEPLTHSEYEDVRKQLIDALEFLTSKLDNAMRRKCEDLIKEISESRLDSATVKTLLEGISGTEELAKKILNGLDELKHTTVKENEKTKKEIVVEIVENRKIMNEIREILKDEERCKQKIFAVLGIELTLKGDKERHELIDEAAKLIISVFNAARENAGSSEYPLVMQAVKNLIEKIESTPGVEVQPAQHKCILLQFGCNSYDGLLMLLTYLESEAYTENISMIVDAVCAILPLKKPISLRSRLNPESLNEILHSFAIPEESETLYRRTVKLPIKVSSVGGIANIYNLFENGGATNSFNKVSETISTHLGAKITLKPSLNLEQVEKELKSAHDKGHEYLQVTGETETHYPSGEKEEFQDNENEDTNRLFKSLILIKSEDFVPSKDSGFEDFGSRKTLSSSRSSDIHQEEESDKTHATPKKKMKKEDLKNISIGMSFKMQQRDETDVRVSSVGPFVSIEGMHSKCFITIGIDPSLLKDMPTLNGQMNAQILANNADDSTLLVAVEDAGTSAGKDGDPSAESLIQADRDYVKSGTKVYKVGVSGCTEGIISGTGFIPRFGSESMIYIMSLPGSQTPFAQNGDAGSAVFCQINDKQCCIGILLGVQAQQNDDEEVFVVKYIDDVVGEMKRAYGKEINFDQYEMNLQVSKIVHL